MAGKEGEELSASVATVTFVLTPALTLTLTLTLILTLALIAQAIFTALVLGFLQAAIFFFGTGLILRLMGVRAGADMQLPALR